MPTTTLNVTFDGSTDVPRLTGQSNVSWFSGFMDIYSIYHSVAGDDLDAEASFTGTDWRIKYFRIAGDDHHTTIQDLDNGAGRRIELMVLGFDSEVDLISTRADHIVGWDGDLHDVTLGTEQSGSTKSIDLAATTNILNTGNAYVASIQTHGTDTINVGSGGAFSLRTGHGDANVTTSSGFVDIIKTGNGNDTVDIGSGGSTFVRTREGDDEVTVGDEDVDTIITNGGDDSVNTGAGGAGFVRTDAGNDTVETGDGYVDLIQTGDDDDRVVMGEGGLGFVRLGSGDDVIIVNEMDPSFGVVIQGGSGIDEISFQPFSQGVIFDLNLAGQYQNVAAPGGDPTTPAKGYVSEVSIENVTGTKFADMLIGDQGANVLKGLAGKDQLSGQKGSDVLKGSGGNDQLDGGNGQDTLIGGGGKDTLTGGRGNDELTGNGGKDVFVMGPNSGIDTVTDFNDGADLLQILGHTGGFGTLAIADQGADLSVVHDGGSYLLEGHAGTALTSDDFDFV